MPGHNIIVIGASAGGVEALKHLVERLPPDLPAAIFVVVHFPATSISMLPAILNRYGPLPAATALDGDAIETGRIYVAPPDYHLLIGEGVVRVQHGPREHHTRPAIDPLFRTAARAYGERVLGVVLSGMLDDGTSGLIEIKQRGGLAIVQSPADALFADMPRSAIKNVDVDYVLPIARMAALLVELARGPGDSEGSVLLTANRTAEENRETTEETSEVTIEDTIQDTIEETIAEIVEEDTARARTATSVEERMDAQPGDNIVARDQNTQISGERDNMPSIYSCPDCGGVLWQMNELDFIRFRCHVGHAFTGEALLLQQAEVLESSMWYAVRTLIDKARLARQLAQKARERGYDAAATRFEEQGATAAQHANVIHKLIENGATGKSVETSGEIFGYSGLQQ